MKRFFLILSFICLIFPVTPIKSIIAQTNQTEKPETQKEENIWKKILAAIFPIFNIINEIDKEFGLAKTDYQISVSENKSSLTNYAATDKDSTTRMSSDADLTFKKGTILKGIIDGTRTDDTIAYLCDNTCSNNKTSDCSDIKYSNLVHFFYKQNKKILYDPSDSTKPIDYNSDKMDSYKYTYKSELNDCFQNLYANMPKVPRGELQGQADAAKPSSKEYNNSLRSFIPISSQTENPSWNISVPENVQTLTQDNELLQRVMFSNIIPAKSQSTILGVSSQDYTSQVLGVSNVSNNASQLKDTATANLLPDSWQKNQDGEINFSDDVPERDDLEIGDWDIGGHCTASRDPNTCNGVKSHCRGMSQYGALGMAESGKNYLEILEFYYGNVSLKTIPSENMSVQIKLEDADNCPDGSSLNVEDYLKGLGEMPNYWGNLGDVLPDGTHQGMNALKAQVVAARTYAYVRTNKFAKPICNSSKCQVFHCSAINSKPNLTKAVNETKGQILVDAVNQTAFSTEYARSFCGPSRTVTCSEHVNPKVDGFQYEIKANKGKPKSCK